MGTSGSEGGPGKPTSRKADRAPRSDPYTEHRTGEGKLYLCAIKDLFSNRIVGYSISDRMKSRLAVDALNSAVASCVVHTGRGSQFRSRKSVRALGRHDMVGSMGGVRPGTTPPWSRSSRCCRTMSSTAARGLRIAVVTWIERTYHRRRRQAALDRLTPVEYETIMTTSAAQAA
jgi:putative transposase